jgi:hypothetical protein
MPPSLTVETQARWQGGPRQRLVMWTVALVQDSLRDILLSPVNIIPPQIYYLNPYTVQGQLEVQL